MYYGCGVEHVVVSKEMTEDFFGWLNSFYIGMRFIAAQAHPLEEDDEWEVLGLIDGEIVSFHSDDLELALPEVEQTNHKIKQTKIRPGVWI